MKGIYPRKTFDNQSDPKAKMDIYVAVQFVNVFKISFLTDVILNKIVLYF